MKLVLKIVAVLALLLVLLVVGAVFFVDGIAKTAVERGGTYALGVDTKLESVDIGLFSGRFGLSKLSVANPPGYAETHFLTLDQAGLDVSLPSLRQDTVVVPRFLIEGVSLDIEKRKDGSNYGTILDHLERLSGPKQPAEPGAEPPPEPGPEEPGAGAKKFVLQEIVVRDVRVNVDYEVELLGRQQASFTVPEIVLTDLGSAEEAKPIQDQVSDIVRALLAAALEAGVGVVPEDVLKDLEGRLDALGADLQVKLTQEVQDKAGALVDQLKGELGGLEGQLGGAAGELGPQLEDITEGAGEQAAGAVEEVQKQAEDALKKLDTGGLLGGKKKDG